MQIDIGDMLATSAWAAAALLKARTEGHDMQAMVRAFIKAPIVPQGPQMVAHGAPVSTPTIIAGSRNRISTYLEPFIADMVKGGGSAVAAYRGALVEFIDIVGDKTFGDLDAADCANFYAGIAAGGNGRNSVARESQGGEDVLQMGQASRPPHH